MDDEPRYEEGEVREEQESEYISNIDYRADFKTFKELSGRGFFKNKMDSLFKDDEENAKYAPIIKDIILKTDNYEYLNPEMLLYAVILYKTYDRMPTSSEFNKYVDTSEYLQKRKPDLLRYVRLVANKS